MLTGGTSVLAQRPDVMPLAATALAWVTVLRTSGAHGDSAGFGTHVGLTVAMTVATMGLFAIPLVRVVAFSSPWWRTRRSVAAAFGAFLGTWGAIALALHAVAGLLGAVLGSTRVMAGVLVAFTALAALGPGRSRRIVGCARPVPLRRDGFEADRDCARSGLLAALQCGRMCAAPMLAMVAVPTVRWLMVALTGIGLAERAAAPRRRSLVAVAYGAAGAALLVG